MKDFSKVVLGIFFLLAAPIAGIFFIVAIYKGVLFMEDYTEGLKNPHDSVVYASTVDETMETEAVRQTSDELLSTIEQTSTQISYLLHKAQ